ncbi:DUF4833 domain-containing protein [Sphingobacterium sp. Mn56C]|uniref:DUF4833 domain-containing protein n=1 Tax=Sphingobacterium sp. Mn56C TaxID=3395261 RepID=UPI003BDFBC35
MKKCILSFLISVSVLSVFGQDGYPTPHVADLLFYIQHNRGKNAFIYQANYSATGELDSNNPIRVTRQIFENKGEIKSLSTVQKTFAYGVNTHKIGDNTYEVSLVSYPAQKLYLSVDKNKHAKIETSVSGVKMKVNRLFIQQREGTSGLNTKVDYIHFFGTDGQGKSVNAKLFPN